MKRILPILLLVLMLPCGAVAQDIPFVVPSLHNWQPMRGGATCHVDDIRSISADGDVFASAVQLVQHRLPQLSSTSVPADAVALRFQLSRDSKLGQEGYCLNITPRGVTIQARTAQGAVWGAQTLLQMIDRTPQLPCGTTIDKPEYPMRGLMLDCGRKYIPMDYLRRLVRCMSHFKMNTLQIHLNDNGFKKYFHDSWDETYAAFRLESELFPGLAAPDGYYSKREFREFILWAQTLGVEIIPEIDAPAHALAFTRFRPDLGSTEFGVDHLDLSNPHVIPFLDSLYSEYLSGPEPIFAGPRVHIGTDEYNNKRQETIEQFRAFTNHYIRLMQRYGKQPKLWGSLTWSRGQTPVDVDGVLMDCWSKDFSQPDSMRALGYQIVAIPDSWMYIVPAAGYYYDYLRDDMIYDRWTPANILGHQFPEHDPQIEGGMFALWNDVCGNGISTYDIHHRLMPALRVMAQKCWSSTATTLPFQQWKSLSQQTHDEPGFTWGVLAEPCQWAQVEPGVNLSSQQPDLGYPYSISFDIEAAAEQPGATLFESDFARFYIADPITGRLGFSRDGCLFSFGYSLRPGERHNLCIEGTNRETRLYVDGRLRETLGYDVRLAADRRPYDVVRTLAFPIQRSGNFHSKVTNLTIRQ